MDRPGRDSRLFCAWRDALCSCGTIINMRTAGVREARQNLRDLLEDVKRGREVLITDRGCPVARLVPIERRHPFPDLARVRRAFRGRDPQLSNAVLEEREDSL